jgi:hypothetical protein
MKNILFNGDFHLTNASSLDDYYALIECDTIDFIDITDTLGAYVDDEGLLHDEVEFKLLFIDKHNKVTRAIAGNLLFVNHNDDGETIALTTEQVLEVLNLTVIDGRIIIKEGV